MKKQIQKEITAVNKEKAMLENAIWELIKDADKYTMNADLFQSKWYENFVIKI